VGSKYAIKSIQETELLANKLKVIIKKEKSMFALSDNEKKSEKAELLRQKTVDQLKLNLVDNEILQQTER